jgi:quercetin dioxygenase-like cupin family protein/mannose-6-phosphate isomerase-like protein (cupin superfamily)
MALSWRHSALNIYVGIMIKGKQAEFGKKSFYQNWVESQGIPIVKDFYIEDLRKVEVAPWAWKGVNGAYMNLIGTGDVNDAYILEIPPTESVNPARVLFEELIYVVEGTGSTSIWNDEKKKITFEWQEGSLFSPSVNTWRQHFNGSGEKPARFLVVTSAPPLFNLFRDLDFITNNPFPFNARFEPDAESFSGAGESYKVKNNTVWDTNFVADVRNMELYAWAQRGGGGSSLMIELSENSMTTHISQFGVGSYKKAHRHGAGAHVVILSGQGYSLMWPEGQEPQRFDWHEGSMVVPPEGWYHQHFNTGTAPARYLALRWGSKKYPRPWGELYAIEESAKTGGAQIEYEDEDPAIRKLFNEELAKVGLVCAMEPINYNVKAA